MNQWLRRGIGRQGYRMATRTTPPGNNAPAAAGARLRPRLAATGRAHATIAPHLALAAVDGMRA